MVTLIYKRKRDINTFTRITVSECFPAGNSIL